MPTNKTLKTLGLLFILGAGLYGTWVWYGHQASGEFGALALILGLFVLGALEG